ncbi:MAG: PD-(D/E)XK nuclease family protein [Cellvibrio sp.]|nr:PD-(D/E)XK nuclease family protein [Cellvibrio sp.]
MLKTPFDEQLIEFFAEFTLDDSLVLTPNKRLSRFFTERYASIQTATAFKSLPCLAIQTWIHQIWSNLEFIDNHPLATSTILSNFQENLLWEKILTDHPETPPLINLRATATQARDAWRLIHEWELDRQELTQSAKAINDPFIFNAWRDEFEKNCKQSQYLTAAEIPGLLAQRIRLMTNVSILNLPKNIYLYGFDELTPTIKSLLKFFELIGIQISNLEFDVKSHSVQRVEFSNEQEELAAVTSWAKQKIIENSNVRIGVVVPDLKAQRSRVEHAFTQEFEPQYIFPDRAQHATGFNISAGQPLSQVPIVSAGLTALGCYAERIEVFQFSALLRSPFIGANKDLAIRALWDLALHNLGELELSFQQFKTLISESLAKHRPHHSRENENPFLDDNEQLDPRLRGDEDAARKSVREKKIEENDHSDFYLRLTQYDLLRKQTKNAKHYPSEWVNIFIETLNAWGWPGDRQLDTLEYQQLQSWQETLDEFSGLDYLLEKINYSTAIDLFTLALQQTDFHAQTTDSPLQILGLLEAAGLPFDYLWIIGLDDDTWPPVAKPNPLLPLTLQRKLNLPQSSPEREFHFSKNLTQRLTQSSVTLIASSVQVKGDKRLSASPLINQFTLINFTHKTQTLFEQLLFQSQTYETYQDFNGPNVINLDSIRGGSQILKSQATCPFQAFARYRLHAEEIPIPGIGLSAQERGNLLHKVMEIIWKELKNHSRLIELTSDSLLDLIDQSISKALQDIIQKPIAGKRFLAIEKKRLTLQILEWLQLEKQRQPFKVLFNESRKTITLNNMPIHIRYDRVDQLEDGSLFVLDYKTGKAEINDWASDRPNEPQVPLYAIANKEKVSGAAFGLLSENNIRFNGVAEDKEIAPGLTSIDKLRWEFTDNLPMNWSNILEHWENVLSKLASKFLEGFAKVDPKNPNTSCRYCQLHSLCRIREQLDLEIETEAEELSGNLANAK